MLGRVGSVWNFGKDPVGIMSINPEGIWVISRPVIFKNALACPWRASGSAGTC